MANDWIKMRMNLADDPAVIGIAARTKLDRYGVVGRLQTLWSWADEHAADGFLPHVTAKVIDEKLGRRGFTAAMEDVGWIECTAEGVRFPKFDRHNGESAKVRALEMERKRASRIAEAEQTRAGRLSAMCPDKSRTDGGQKPPEIGTREEKRREEESSGRGSSSPAPGAPAFGALPEATTTTRHNKILDESDFEELQRRFPLVDLAQQRREALAYVRKERGEKAELELRFFAEAWLPKAPVRTEERQERATGRDEPEGWQAWMDENFPAWKYAAGQEPGPLAWKAHAAIDRKFIREQMAKGGAR